MSGDGSLGCKLYELVPLVSGPKFVISSATAAGRKLYVGSEDGGLRIFESRDSPLLSSKPAFELTETVPKFSRKKSSLLHLCAISHWRALLCFVGAYKVGDAGAFQILPQHRPPLLTRNSPPPNPSRRLRHGSLT
jgi:hypothetical protein